MKITAKTKFRQTEAGMIPEDWEVLELQQMSNVIDSLHVTPNYSSEGIPMVRATDVKRGSLHLERTLRVTREVYEEFTRNHKPRRNDIVMSRVGTYFVTSFVETDGPFCIGQNTVIICPSVNSRFVYYSLNSRFVTRQIEEELVGSGGQETISLEDIRELLIPKPTDEREIEAISRILSDLDSKIELNNQMNKTLEAIGQAIFKHWFIDFEFPNEEGNPYRSSGGEMIKSELGQIPRGWRIGVIPEIADVIYGYPFDSKLFNDETGFPLARIRDLPRDKPGTLTTEGFDRKYVIRKGDIVTGMDGEFRTYLWKGHDVLQNQRICKFIGKTEQYSNAFIYLVVSKPLRTVEGAKVGTTVIHLSKTDIDSTKVVIPTQDVLKKYDEVSVLLFENMISNTQETLLLEELRDLLLPKLMSGRIRVPVEVR